MYYAAEQQDLDAVDAIKTHFTKRKDFNPSQLLFDYPAIYFTGEEKWNVVEACLNRYPPHKKTVPTILFKAVESNAFGVVKQLCNLSMEARPSIHDLKEVSKIAKKMGHTNIAKYLSYEIKCHDQSTFLGAFEALLTDYTNGISCATNKMFHSKDAGKVKKVLHDINQSHKLDCQIPLENNNEYDASSLFDCLKDVKDDDLRSRIEYLESRYKDTLSAQVSHTLENDRQTSNVEGSKMKM